MCGCRSPTSQQSHPNSTAKHHLISLELGGAPRDPDNLWPEPWFGVWNARVKDKLENTLHDKVCGGEVPLRTAQKEIATDWIAAYQKYIAATP